MLNAATKSDCWEEDIKKGPAADQKIWKLSFKSVLILKKVVYNVLQ